MDPSSVPQWVWDWSGSVCVMVSFYFLWTKRYAYWHFSNASLLPYFVLFETTAQYMLAGLQAIYLLFGLHGLTLWFLENRKHLWAKWFRPLTTPLTLSIFFYAVYVTEFAEFWTYLQLAIVSVSLVANWGTTRRYAWSWLVWLPVNAAQAVYFFHGGLWGLFLLQFVLFAMSLKGYLEWKRDEHLAMAGRRTA